MSVRGWDFPGPEVMARALLDWYDAHGRPLPWRGIRDPYRIWLAEIMLQQTGVETVRDYYARFVARFPDLDALARAEREEVLALWQGLGYYRRAAHLHESATRVAREMGGRLPTTPEALAALPGIGPSTAGAILAIAFGQQRAILDGNVKRVLARVLALEERVDTAAGQRLLWETARHLTPASRPGDYAQAIMDLGAGICRHRRPGCPQCPWSSWCRAHALEEPEGFPRVTPKGSRPEKDQFCALVSRGDGWLLMRPRPARGLLGGMWEPPGGELSVSPEPPAPERVRDELAARFGLTVGRPEPVTPVRHAFTHFRLTLYPYGCQWLGGDARENTGLRWVDGGDRGIPVSTLHRKVLAVWMR